MQSHHDVLVVEDDPELNELVGAYATMAGFNYRAALNGSQALEQVARDMPAAIVLDLMLPDMSGFDVCSRIRSSGPDGKIPVIILTALDSADARKKGIECGATEYLTKPFDPDVLMKVLARYADTHPHPA